MSFYASSNRILIKDTGGRTVLDTDMKMPTILETKESYITLQRRDASSSGTSTADHTLATGINQATNFYFAMVRPIAWDTTMYNELIYNNSTLLAYDHWVPVLGSFMLNGYLSGAPANLHHLRTITFLLSGGTLTMREQYFCKTALTYPRFKEITLWYRVFLGAT
jgi:hypothetical protein